MDRFIARFQDQITGHLSAFDRMILKGTLRTLVQPEAFEHWLCWKKVLFKDYKAYAKRQSERLAE